MNAVVYASKGGNTRKLAEAVAAAVGACAQPVEEVRPFDAPIDTLFVGGSIYAGKIDGALRKFLQGLDSGHVTRIAVFGSAAGNKSALDEVRAILTGTGITVYDRAFQCRGSFLLANRGRPNQDDLNKAAQFAREVAGT
ncbi:MAG: flavodoxin [Clostridiales Family XIII bacterium]|jgi:flavodoxin|nr:flavodoxin [Clostridiales Family XIII bacterium]